MLGRRRIRGGRENKDEKGKERGEERTGERRLLKEKKKAMNRKKGRMGMDRKKW